MKKSIIIFLLLLILTSYQNLHEQGDKKKELIQQSDIIDTKEIIDVSQNSTFEFHDEAIKNTIENYFEKDITSLTAEDYEELSKFDYLVVEDIVNSIDDIERLFPNIKYLYINVDILSAELYDDIKKLSHLKALTLYCNSITITDFKNDYQYFEVAYTDDKKPSSNNILSRFSINHETLLNKHLEGNIQKIVRLNDNGNIYELISTDHYTEGELWEKQERFVFVYENGSQNLKTILDAGSEIGSYTRNSLQLIDINFDGIPDILIDNGHFGTQGAVTYTCFFNNKDNYIRCDSFSSIANPAIDIKNKKILSTWRNWAASHSFAMFTLQNNEFIMTDCLTEEADRSGDDVWIFTIEKLVDGDLQKTETFTSNDYSDEEIYDMIYHEDSYWGLLSDKWNTLYNQGKMVGFSIYGDSKINSTIQRIISTSEELTQ
ncbi:hypothetical protein ABFV83_10065 [Lacrimispora sp. BS-2]|uniref:FG-GAP repeat protein n=1 Tax=Lacrimispora sp. BS-2 TaxID=3151850 RepID=A0AAU7PUP9_9FIRM